MAVDTRVPSAPGVDGHEPGLLDDHGPALRRVVPPVNPESATVEAGSVDTLDAARAGHGRGAGGGRNASEGAVNGIEPLVGPAATVWWMTRRGTRRWGEPADHALGRSRGGLSTKIHLAADGHARPLALAVTAGQAGDAPAFETVMARIRVARTGPGRPRTRPTTVLADRAYSSRAIRGHLRRRQIRAIIPQPSDQIGTGRQGGRPPGFDADAYKQRNTVERCINRLKQWRGLATRTDKLARDRT